MNKDQVTWCTCEGHDSSDWTIRSDFYCKHFLPSAWALEYQTLDRGDARILYLTGICDRCGGFMRSGSSVASNIGGDTLLAEIYRQMTLFRPYDWHDQKTGKYCGYIGKRSRWYQQQDDLTQEERNEQFLRLFRDQDQTVVREWLSRHHAEEPYTKPRRDRISTLFRAVLAKARADDAIKDAEAILEYILPNDEEPAWPEQDTYLTDYRFNVVPYLAFGSSEGIYLSLYLEGSFDMSERKKIELGTCKTLRTDLEACSLMGALGGILMYYAAWHVNQNIHRYTPEPELAREYERQLNNALSGKEQEKRSDSHGQ